MVASVRRGAPISMFLYFVKPTDDEHESFYNIGQTTGFMRSYIHLILFATILILFSQGCTRRMYTPNMHHVPIMKEKGELRSNFSLENFQASYGLANGLGVMFNGHLPTLNDFTDLGEDYSARRYFFETGLGYFKPISEWAVFEIYGGAGLGGIAFDDRGLATKDKFSTQFSRYFIQPSIGWTNENIDIAFSLRFVNVRFFDLDTSEYEYDGSNVYDQDLSIIDQHTYTFAEPALTFRAGWKTVKIQFQVVRVSQLSFEPLNFKNVEYSLGIHFNLANRYRTESKGLD